jgi:hypothetical protein
VVNPALRASIPARAIEQVDSVTALIHAGTFSSVAK